MWKVLAQIGLIIGLIVAIVNPSGGFVMPTLEWFVLGIGLALLDGLNSDSARRL
jgi:hypothetical protein